MGVQAVVFVSAEERERAERLADRFTVPCYDGRSLDGAKAKFSQAFLVEHVGDDALAFMVDADGLRLQTSDAEALSVRVDFTAADVDYRRRHGGGRSQMIAKAVGLRPGVFPRVFDATAGLGGDAFVLAGLGCGVTLAERVPEVWALLEDGLRRARLSEDAGLQTVLERMCLVRGGAGRILEESSDDRVPEVVYLDPMFPERQKSALVKQEMRLFHRLVGTDSDAAELLAAALDRALYRVVVKRPRTAKPLFGPEPSHILEGKRNRYDIYTKAKLPDGLHAGALGG